jgi:hypothetical protein
MRDYAVSSLAVPLLVVAILAGILGFLLARQIAPPPKPTTARLSVVALPATPTPTPLPTPVPEPATDGGGSSGSGNNCPAGCQCSGQPNGIIVICH